MYSDGLSLGQVTDDWIGRGIKKIVVVPRLILVRGLKILHIYLFQRLKGLEVVE